MNVPTLMEQNPSVNEEHEIRLKISIWTLMYDFIYLFS